MTEPNMLPVGYLAKIVKRLPAFVNVPQVVDVYSVSGCISNCFADYVKYWKHNGWWLFDSPQIIEKLITDHHIPSVGLTYFYYEVFDQEYDQSELAWKKISLPTDFPINIAEPDYKNFVGYDVATFSCRNHPECSPLSCNYLAREIPTNKYCLFENFEQAWTWIENGDLVNVEPGPLRIMAVYTLDDTRNRRERLRYRSHHRGTKEMDVLLGRFAERYLDGFGVIELAEYEALLEEQDQDLYDWALGRSVPPAEKLTGLYKLYVAG